MPGFVQLPELTLRVRRRADMVNSTFCTDAEIEEYIEQSMGALFDLVIESNGARHWVAMTQPQSTVAGQAAYSEVEILPGGLKAQLYKIVGVDVLWNNKWRKVPPALVADWNQQEDLQGWTNWRDVRYHFYQAAYLGDVTEAVNLQQIVRFMPTPQAVHSFRVRYIPYPNDWSSAPTTYFQSYSGWDEYIVCDAAAKCLEKEESFQHAQSLLARRDQAADRIRWHAQTMNEDGQGRIRDLDDETDFGWGSW